MYANRAVQVDTLFYRANAIASRIFSRRCTGVYRGFRPRHFGIVPVYEHRGQACEDSASVRWLDADLEYTLFFRVERKVTHRFPLPHTGKYVGLKPHPFGVLALNESKYGEVSETGVLVPWLEAVTCADVAIEYRQAAE